MVDLDPGPLTLEVARILAPVTVLGPGRRVGLWVQGCAIACEGCSSRDTWDPHAGHTVTVDDLVTALSDALTDAPDGLTVTGGEPTDQADALIEVIDGLRGSMPGLDVLVFTGRSLAAARRRARGLIERADAVVAGRYQQDRPRPHHRLLATTNQELLLRQESRSRYETWLAESDPERMQVLVTGESLQLVGLPAPGDLDRLERDLLQRGVSLGGVSWRS